MNIGERIKNLRKEKKLTQPAFASILEKSVRMVQKYENNEVVPSIEQVEQIAKVLEVSPADIMGWDYFDKSFDTVKIQKDIRVIEYLKFIGYNIQLDMVATEWDENPDGSKYAVAYDENPDAPFCTIIKDGIVSSFTNQQFDKFKSDIANSVQYHAFEYRKK